MSDEELAEAIASVTEEENESERKIAEVIESDIEETFGVDVSANVKYNGNGQYRVTVPMHQLLDELEGQADYERIHISPMGAFQFQLSRHPESE